MENRDPAYQRLEEDLLCPLCLRRPIRALTIPCGHTFCGTCIDPYRTSRNPQLYNCPKCRKETRARPIELVYTDESGKLWVDGSAVQTCFMDPELSDLPVCLIFAIGEKRWGKSFLMNYILRALSCQERGEPLSLGPDGEPLNGFEWKAGVDSVTKGIWIWNKPFVLEVMSGKMAVFVLDTEGSLDIQSSQEICIKLSALSMILSSYLIFNVNSFLKTTELDYLEMFLHVAKETGESFDLQCLQHLDILIRDWYDSKKCSQNYGNAYICHEIEKLSNSSAYASLLPILGGSSVTCSLLPHPGANLSQGMLSDMDENFRNHLQVYILSLVKGLDRYVKTDRHGRNVTCNQLGTILKKFVQILRNKEYRFGSQMQMHYSFKNYISLETCKQQFHNNLQLMKQKRHLKIFRKRPSKMKSSSGDLVKEQLADYERSLEGCDEEQKKELVKQMEASLKSEQETFCNEYAKQYRKYAIKVGAVAAGVPLAITGAALGAVFLPVAIGGALAAEAAVAAGVFGGTLTLGGFGTGVGAFLGKIFTRKKKSEQANQRGDTP
uniref:Ring finger protein 112, gene 2 n=1 Tax=Xenopus tropicalis TaxID=8364 RepID=A0A803KC53_XENTR